MDDEIKFAGCISLISIAIAILVIGGCSVKPIYNVWAYEKEGEAELAKAKHNKQILIEEANSRLESSKLLSLAEIERAKGVAEANKIIGDSLKGNDSYLRYLWIDKLNENNQNVIYVPTEAGLPILEAGKR